MVASVLAATSDIFGVPVEIAAVVVAALLGGLGFLLQRFVFPPKPEPEVMPKRDAELPPKPSSPPEPPPVTSLLVAARWYVSVISKPEISDAHADRAAMKLLGAAALAQNNTPAAAKAARSLAAESDCGRASVLLRELEQLAVEQTSSPEEVGAR